MAINYTEKGAGLHEAVAAAGHMLRQHDGSWVSNDDAAVQAIIDGYTLTMCHDRICADIETHAQALRDAFVSKRRHSPGEMASWPQKRREAKDWQTLGPAADTPMLDAIAAHQGVSRAQVATRVLAAASVYEAFEAGVDGQAGKHKAAVKAMASFAAALAYDWRAGWPSTWCARGTSAA